ncbi:MAG: hypothetical protein WD648_05375 [Planctomycetaceae bacterium]
MFSTNRRRIAAASVVLAVMGVLTYVLFHTLIGRRQISMESGVTSMSATEYIRQLEDWHAILRQQSATRAQEEDEEDVVYRKARSLLDDVYSADVLKEIFYTCGVLRKKELRERDVEDFSPSVYFLAEDAVVDRLAELNNDASAAALVSILNDPSVSLDASRAVSVMNSISQCGAKAVPLLKQVAGERAVMAKEVIASIERGELYGP